MPFPAIIGAAALPTVVAFLLKAFVAHLIFRVITALGIAIISFVAIDAAANKVTDYIHRALGSVSGEVRQVAEMVGFFDCVNIVLSAYLTAMTIRQIRGLYNRMVFGMGTE